MESSKLAISPLLIIIPFTDRELKVRRQHTFEFMQHSSTGQRMILGVGVIMLVLGAGFTYFQAAHKTWSWPMAILFGSVWCMIGVLAIWRICRSTGPTTKK